VLFELIADAVAKKAHRLELGVLSLAGHSVHIIVLEYGHALSFLEQKKNIRYSRRLG
jgi:hypothetical protein